MCRIIRCSSRPLTAPQWTMHFDPERYPDPEKFNVRRFVLRTFDPSTHIATRWHAKSPTGTSGTTTRTPSPPISQIRCSATTGCSVPGPSSSSFSQIRRLLSFASSSPHSRRICPGIALAEQEIFLAVAHLLWAFRMEQLPDEPIDLKEYDGLSGRSPVPFRIRMIPRDDHVAEILGLTDPRC